MKKKIIVGLLIMSMTAMAACGNVSNSGNSKDTKDSNVSEVQVSTDSGSSQKTEKTETVSKESLMIDFGATIEETVLLDEKGVKITAKDLTYSSYSAELHLMIENNTDKELSFIASSGWNSVNGYMIADGYINEKIAAGMNSNETISFSLDQLSFYGFRDIADISLRFEIKDGYDEYLVTSSLAIKTNIADSYDYSRDYFVEAMSGKVMPQVYGYTINYSASDKLFDELGVTILNEYVVTNKEGNQALLMEVENHSDHDFYVVESDVQINGLAVSSGSWDSEYIVAGKRAVMTFTFDKALGKNYLKILGMNQYGSCGMNFVVKDEKGKELAGKQIEINFGEGADLGNYNGEVLYDNNGYTFKAIGLIEDSSDYSDDMHALFLMKNNSDKPVYVSNGFNNVYVNKTKISDSSYGRTVQPGGYGLLDIELNGSDLKKNGLDKTNITEVTTKFKIGDGNYTYYDEPDITMSIS